MNNAILNQANTYTEFSGLNALKAQAKNDEAAALKEVARQFESMFVSMMLKSMRDANKAFEEGNFLNSNQTSFYRDIFDSQLALSMTEGKGIGLAESLYRQLSKETGVVPASATGEKMTLADYPRERAPVIVKLAETLEEVNQIVDSTVKTKQEDSFEKAAIYPVGKRIADEIEVDELEPFAATIRSEPVTFESAQEFVDYLYPYAKKVEEESGIDARFLLAQSALETGWGKHMIIQDGELPSHNLFGIKADNRWDGDSVDITTTEYREGLKMKEVASFRSYASYEDSFRDYVEFIQSNDRYSEAVDVMNDPEKFVEELHKAGYATDPNYSEKVQRIFNSDLLRSALTTDQVKG